MYRLPPALVGIVVLIITLLEAANVVATLWFGKGDISFHAVFLAVMTAVGLAVRPASSAPADPAPPASGDTAEPVGNPGPTTHPPGPRHGPRHGGTR